MPKADPEAWAAARTDWELMPERTLTEVAASLNVSIPTVSQRATRDGWAKVAVIDASLPAQTSAALVVVAMRRLAKIAEHSKDDNTAMKAARIILENTLGKSAPPGMLPAPGDDPSEGWPEWLTARRLAYQEGRGVLQAPPQDLDPPAEPPEAPAAPLPTLQPPSPPRPVPFDDPFRPQPTFHDGPNRPATGILRDHRTVAE